MASTTTSRTAAEPLPIVQPRVSVRRMTPGKIVLWILVILVTLVALFPFLYAVTTSFKSQRDSYDGTLIPWLQYEPTLASWQAEFGSGAPETFRALLNSTLIASGATFLSTVLGSLAGFGLGRFKY